jgi:hypothetical protein
MKSELTRKRMSESAKARCTLDWKKAQSEKRRFKDETHIVTAYQSGMTQIEVARKFCISRKIVENALRRAGVKCRRKVKRNQTGPLNDNWSGRSATILSKHKRLYRAFGQPSKCDVCGTTDESKHYDWANLSGDYDDPLDFKRMCRSCHWKYDKKHLNLKGAKGARGHRGAIGAKK